MEYPVEAVVIADMEHLYSGRRGPGKLHVLLQDLAKRGTMHTILGQSQESYELDQHVASVQILIQTNGCPCQARIELAERSDTIQQVIEIYTEDGSERPFFAVLETPGATKSLRIVNVGETTFPIMAAVQPYKINTNTKPPTPPRDTTFQVEEEDEPSMPNHAAERIYPNGKAGVEEHGFFFVN
jgi:hypothetical protein